MSSPSQLRVLSSIRLEMALLHYKSGLEPLHTESTAEIIQILVGYWSKHSAVYADTHVRKDCVHTLPAGVR